MAGKFLHGAFVQFMETFLIPAPNVILFQFNPEAISHSWTPAQTSSDDDDNPLAVNGPPAESFDFTLAMDARDMIADGSPMAACPSSRLPPYFPVPPPRYWHTPSPRRST